MSQKKDESSRPHQLELQQGDSKEISTAQTIPLAAESVWARRSRDPKFFWLRRHRGAHLLNAKRARDRQVQRHQDLKRFP